MKHYCCYLRGDSRIGHHARISRESAYGAPRSHLAPARRVRPCRSASAERA